MIDPETFYSYVEIAYKAFSLVPQQKVVPVIWAKEKQDRIEAGRLHCPYDITEEQAIKLTLLSDLLDNPEMKKKLPDDVDKQLLFHLVSSIILQENGTFIGDEDEE